MKNRKLAKKRTGPKPERVKLESDWETAVASVLKLKRPKEGWPDDKRKAKGA